MPPPAAQPHGGNPSVPTYSYETPTSATGPAFEVSPAEVLAKHAALLTEADDFRKFLEGIEDQLRMKPCGRDPVSLDVARAVTYRAGSFLQLNELPVVIDVPTLGRTDTERRQLVAHTLDGLRERRLFGDRGVDPDLTDLLVTLARMCARHGQLGQFGALVRDHLGRQRSGRRVIGLHATPDGWYSQLRRIGHGGTFVTVTPASQDVVTTPLRELITETRQLAGWHCHVGTGVKEPAFD